MAWGENPNAHPGGHENLFTKLQLFCDRVIAWGIRPMQIIQQLTALAHHHDQTTARTVIFFVLLQVLGQVIDPLGQQSDLNIGRTGVALMNPIIYNLLCFRVCFHIP